METITLTEEQARQIEEAFVFLLDEAEGPDFVSMASVSRGKKALAAIRAARAQKQEPVRVVEAYGYGGTTGVHDYLMSDGSVRAMTTDEALAITRAAKAQDRSARSKMRRAGSFSND